MKVTRVFELKTQEDADLLFKTLRRLKRRSSAALRYTVAVTAERNSTVKEPTDGREHKDPIEGQLDRLSGKL